jgi:hypothetical protein
MNPGSVDPLPGISLEDLINEAKEQIKTDTDGKTI